MARVTELIFRVVGKPPGPGPTRRERLRWVRRFCRLGLAAIALDVIFALTNRSAFLWIVAAVLGSIWVVGFAFLSIRIRRMRSTGRLWLAPGRSTTAAPASNRERANPALGGQARRSR
jgi:hypothetical protein